MISASLHLPDQLVPAPPRPPAVPPQAPMESTGGEDPLPQPAVVVSPVPADPAPRANTPLMRKEHREKIALFRYQLIREAADDQLGAKARGVMVRALATQYHPWPFGGTKRFSRESIDRWIKAWKKDGFDGLKPTQRAQGPITEPRVLLLAETLKREKPHRTAAQIKRIIATTWAMHPRKRRCCATSGPWTFPPAFPGPPPAASKPRNPTKSGWAMPCTGRGSRDAKPICSRSSMTIPGWWSPPGGPSPRTPSALAAVLRPALQTHGIPRQVYVDNGSCLC